MSLLAGIIDSRNLLGQIASVTGVRRRPQVDGIRRGMRELGYDLSHVHVGLALPRPADAQALSSQQRTNLRYKADVEAAHDAEVLLGELHVKRDRYGNQTIEEKMVDGACNVCITKYVDSIKAGSADVDGVLVLSKDIDLTPAIQHGLASGVPVHVGAVDVVQHRQHPYVLLPATVLAVMAGCDPATSGHKLRTLAALALYDRNPMSWTVAARGDQVVLEHLTGLTGVPVAETMLPTPGSTVSLHAVDVDFSVRGLEGFPALLLSSGAAEPPVDYRTVRRRQGPLAVELEGPRAGRMAVPIGGVVPGDRISIHRPSNRFIGQLPVSPPPRSFDPDLPLTVRIATALAGGGYIGVDANHRRGLIATSLVLKSGDKLPVIQVDESPKGPNWVALGSPLV